jgi:hypothetical protein
MSEKEIISVIIGGALTCGVLAFLVVCAIAIYLEAIKPHLLQAQKKARRIMGFRLVVDREPEVKSDDYYRRQSL